ncbi:hypothetical protein PVMG_05588 [Plasmodium vivax Mauritania I]|uniref:VIR protein n=1 Tax=Plasmodium vivax Mauritania I TaxID=1035515 RepID=A0A0J9TJ01_PLAVI|nr:hypothetical protein PVMG_05588 [Plasmodium vivax Mauritania I]
MKSSFYSVKNFTYPEDIYNTVVNSLKIPSRASDFKNVLLMLIKYLSGHGAFISHGSDRCCKYINYKLNDELKTVFYEVNESMFKIFQEFVQEHDKKKGTKTCTSELHYPGSHIVYRLRHLYDLFDLYDELKNFSKLYNNESFCSKLTKIVHKYNLHIDEYYEKDENLFKKLTYFKELVEKLKLPPNCACPEKIQQLKTPAKYLLDQEELSKKQKLEEESQRKSPHGPSVSLTTKESEPLVGGSLEKGESVSSDDQQFISLSGQTQDFTVLKHESGLRDNKETGNYRPAEITEALVTHESSTFSEESRYQTGYALGPFNPRKLSRQNGEVHDSYNLEKPTSDGEGIIRTLQSTFYTIVDNVDPAPVLGVSGGMGALYILLRVLKICNL